MTTGSGNRPIGKRDSGHCSDGAIDPVSPAPLDPDVLRLRGNDYLVAALTGLAALGVYLSMLAPTVTGEDSGELIAAAYTLGIAHPPGYPLWCLLGKLFTLIVPFGPVAWRVGVMSAFWGAATASLICLIVIKFTRNRLAALSSGLALAFSKELWEQSVVAEVYSLNAFLIALCILLLVGWQDVRRKSLLYVFAVVYALGLCNHHTMHFLGPVFVLFIMAVHRRPWRHWKTYLSMLGVAACVWLLVHLYLPIRSMANPRMDWGNPETWDNFWYVVLRHQYGLGFTANPHSLARLRDQFGAFFGMYAGQFTVWFAVVPLLGACLLWRMDRRRFGLIAGTFLYVVVGFILILNFDSDRRSVWVNGTFFIPAYLLAAILMGVAIAWIASLGRGRFPFAAAGLVLAVTVPTVPLWANYHANDKSNYYVAYDYAMNAFETLDENAIYFPEGDHRDFPLAYLQTVDGVRPDVTIGRRYGRPDEDLYAAMPNRLRSTFSPWPSEGESRTIEDWIAANTDRPVYLTRKRPIQGVPGARAVAVGLVFKVTVAGTTGPKSPPSNRDYWSEYAWHTLDDVGTHEDLAAENILSDVHLFRGQYLFGKGRNEEGLDELAAAADIARDRKDLINEIGLVCSQHRLYGPSRDYFLKALEYDPDYRISLWNLARAYWLLDDFDGARKSYERVLKNDQATYGANDPRIAPCLNNLGGALLGLGRFDDARACFEYALGLDETATGTDSPNAVRDLYNLGLALKALGDSQGEVLHQQVIDVYTQRLGQDHPTTVSARQGVFMESMAN